MFINENKPYYYIEKEDGGCNVISQVKEFGDYIEMYKTMIQHLLYMADDDKKEAMGTCLKEVIDNEVEYMLDEDE